WILKLVETTCESTPKMRSPMPHQRMCLGDVRGVVFMGRGRSFLGVCESRSRVCPPWHGSWQPSRPSRVALGDSASGVVFGCDLQICFAVSGLKLRWCLVSSRDTAQTGAHEETTVLVD